MYHCIILTGQLCNWIRFLAAAVAAVGGFRAEGEMELSDLPYREIEALRERLSRHSEASRRINESLDFDRVPQGALDSARSLTVTRYGVMDLMDDGTLKEAAK